jgi:hypothetical protein
VSNEIRLSDRDPGRKGRLTLGRASGRFRGRARLAAYDAEVHMNGLDGKVAIVTGGGSGLGEAIGKDAGEPRA